MLTEHAVPEPAWAGYCADPFVLADRGRFVMYGTDPGVPQDGQAFVTLVSDDLRTWTEAGHALQPPADAGPDAAFWAPEVTRVGDRYYMYYSMGRGEVGHHLRVAVADSAIGPFVDLGLNLTPDLPFAIDPSPFRDVDGSWWLFFATDRLESSRPGTVLAAARLHDMTRLDAAEVLLTAHADWQRYQRDRDIYGGLRDWHTLEGPHVVAQDGRYWMFYSGGNWQGTGYGVALAVAPHPTGPWAAVGQGPTVLSSPATGLAGPGHNSVLRTEAGDFIVFHAWDDGREQRRPFIVPLRWTGEGFVPDLAAAAAARPAHA